MRRDSRGKREFKRWHFSLSNTLSWKSTLLRFSRGISHAPIRLLFLFFDNLSLLHFLDTRVSWQKRTKERKKEKKLGFQTQKCFWHPGSVSRFRGKSLSQVVAIFVVTIIMITTKSSELSPRSCLDLPAGISSRINLFAGFWWFGCNS